MKRFPVFCLAAALVFAACTDNPSTPGGTLPVVQNCRILFEQCRGDTVYIGWDALDVDVDFYRVWFASTDPGNWEVVDSTESTVSEDIALSTGYYCVDAVAGEDESQEQSDKADNRTIRFVGEGDTLTYADHGGMIFGDSTIVFGDPTDPAFEQDLVLVGSATGLATAWSGDFDPGTCPGGSSSLLALVDGSVAPPADSAAWVDHVDLGDEEISAYVRLESGYYAWFALLDTTDSTFVFWTSQLHAWPGIRLFNLITI